jgi:hypothetical protein
MIAAAGTQHGASVYVQPHEQFVSAIDDDSTNDAFVLVTVVDGSSGRAKSGCVEAHFLLGAIHIERRLRYDSAGNERARQVARSADGNRFVFRSRAALKNLNFANFSSANQQACKLIRGGSGAKRNDISGQITPVRN